MKASVIIPTMNKTSRLALVLQSLSHQINEEVEIILILDGCDKETRDTIEQLQSEFSFKSIVCDNNIGRSKARNLGIRAARGEIVIFIDDDRIPGPDYIEKQLIAHQKECVVLGLRKSISISEQKIGQVYRDKTILHDFNSLVINSKTEFAEYTRNFACFHRFSPVRWVGLVTGNLSVRKSHMFEVGLFDEKFTGWGWEDVELGYRLFKKNIPFIKDNRIINYHIEHRSNRGSIREDELKNYNYFYQKIKKDTWAAFILRCWRVYFNASYKVR